MNRPLRFRYWDAVIKFMVLSDEFECLAHFFAKAENYSGGVIMQFTGLIDSKGKDIYEGDILHGKISTGHSRTAKHRDWVCKVEWSDWNAGWVMNGPTDERWRFFPCWKSCEVVGNIFENP